MQGAQTHFQHRPTQDAPISVGRQPPTPQEWHRVQAAVWNLYVVEKLPLKDVKDRLEKDYGFRASERMYKSRLKTWGFLKNAKKDDWAALATIQRRRKEQGKKATIFTVRGRQRTVKDLQKYIRSLNMTDEDFLASQGACIEIPDYIRAFTPDVDMDLQEQDVDRTDHARMFVRTAQDIERMNDTQPSVSTPGDERELKYSPSGSSSFDFSTPSPTPLTATGLSLNSSSIRHSNSVFSERSPNTATTESDFYESVPTPCDQLQRDIEAIGYQMISPAPLPSRYGSEDIENWTLVNAHTPQSSSPGTPNFEFLCSRCHQPSTHHFASLDNLAPRESPSRRARSILNDASSDSWNLPQSTKNEDGAWKWVARCFLACMKLTRGNIQLSSSILDDAAHEFEKMLLSNDEMLLTAAQLVSSILVMHDQGEIARTVMDSAHRVTERLLQGDDPIRILIAYLTASADGKLHESGITSQELKGVYEHFLAKFDARHPYTIEASYSYGWMLKFEGNATEAERVLTQTYWISCSVFGQRHMQSIFALASLAGTELLLNKQEEAISHFETVISDAGSVLGISHPYSLEGKRRLAALLSQRDEEGGAEIPSLRVEGLYWEVLLGRVKMLGPSHTYTEGAREDYERVCNVRGVWQEREHGVRKLFGQGNGKNIDRPISRGSDNGSETGSIHEAY